MLGLGVIDSSAMTNGPICCVPSVALNGGLDKHHFLGLCGFNQSLAGDHRKLRPTIAAITAKALH